MRISDWSSDVCSSDLAYVFGEPGTARPRIEQKDVGSGCLFATGKEAVHVRGLERRLEIRIAQERLQPRPKQYALADDADAIAARSVHDPLPFPRSEEHTSELQSLMRISYAVFCLKQKTNAHTKCITSSPK